MLNHIFKQVMGSITTLGVLLLFGTIYRQSTMEGFPSLLDLSGAPLKGAIILGLRWAVKPMLVALYNKIGSPAKKEQIGKICGRYLQVYSLFLFYLPDLHNDA